MSIEEANKSRFERGMMNLTELEGELLEALEEVIARELAAHDSQVKPVIFRYPALKKAYGHD